VTGVVWRSTSLRTKLCGSILSSTLELAAQYFSSPGHMPIERALAYGEGAGRWGSLRERAGREGEERGCRHGHSPLDGEVGMSVRQSPVRTLAAFRWARDDQHRAPAFGRAPKRRGADRGQSELERSSESAMASPRTRLDLHNTHSSARFRTVVPFFHGVHTQERRGSGCAQPTTTGFQPTTTGFQHP